MPIGVMVFTTFSSWMTVHIGVYIMVPSMLVRQHPQQVAQDPLWSVRWKMMEPTRVGMKLARHAC